MGYLENAMEEARETFMQFVKDEGDRIYAEIMMREAELQHEVERARANAAHNRDVLVLYRTKDFHGWGQLDGTQWHDGCIVLNKLTADGPMFFNNVECLLLDFKRRVSTDEVVVIYLDTGERK